MRVNDFDFDLPEDRIALRPAEPRDASRMLHVARGDCGDHHVRDLPQFLQPGDTLVFNDTKVIAAELEGVRRRPQSQARVTINLHKRLDDARWMAFARPAKRLQPGAIVSFSGGLEGEVLRRDGGEVEIAFSASGPAFDAALRSAGKIPLPPYISAKRSADEADQATYQTIYAKAPGAVAAPTAGLHFTPDLFTRIETQGIGTAFLTLHVGAGTFLPVKVDDTADHKMHAEWGEVSLEVAEKLNKARATGGRIVAVGTTSLRLLETATGSDGEIKPFAGDTDIFITPGYNFRAVDVLLTNFHLPRSTLFMLVSAFAGLEAMQQSYAHAIATGYRFYSYGDATLLERSDE